MIKVRKKRNNREAKEVQKPLIEWCSYYPKLKKHIIAIQNEYVGSVWSHIEARKMGKVKGASDIFLAIPSKGFHGLWLELKATGGVVSQEQKDFLSARAEMNYDTHIAWSFDDATKKISEYLDYKLGDFREIKNES